MIQLDERPAFVAFDPELRVVGDLNFDAPSDMLRAQLQHATHAISRSRAADALSRRDDPPTIAALAACLARKSEAWMVRAKPPARWAEFARNRHFSALSAEVSADHPKLRRAVASALGNFKTAAAAQLLTKRAKSDPSYLVEAESTRALGRTRQPEALEGDPAAARSALVGRGRARGCALDALGALRDEQALPEIIKRTQYGYPTRARRAAIAPSHRSRKVAKCASTWKTCSTTKTRT